MIGKHKLYLKYGKNILFSYISSFNPLIKFKTAKEAAKYL